jgi:hypothetical protein
MRPTAYRRGERERRLGTLNSRWLQLAEERSGGQQAIASQQPAHDCGDPDAE